MLYYHINAAVTTHFVHKHIILLYILYYYLIEEPESRRRVISVSLQIHITAAGREEDPLCCMNIHIYYIRKYHINANNV